MNELPYIKQRIKEFCKNHKLKLDRYTKDGFIAYKLMPIKAGMEIDIVSLNLVSIPIRKIGTKKVYQSFTYCLDGDIYQNNKLNIK